MIRTRTCLVLGAGASKPYGFPTGAGLLHQIVKGLTNPLAGLYNALKSGGAWQPNDLAVFAQELGGSHQPSVDVFLSNRLDEFEVIGKEAIAAALIHHESEDNLRNCAPEANWYAHLWQRLTSSGRNELAGNHLTVVTFNYDRSLEWFLFNAFRRSFGGSLADARKEVASAIPITHVHGQLGALALEPNQGWREYSEDASRGAILAAAEGIVILPRAQESSREFQIAAHQIRDAEQVVFLGFGYHPENLRRLGLRESKGVWRSDKPRMLGSSFGMTPRECERSMGRCGIFPSDPRHDSLAFLRHEVDFD